ncbi:DUF6522 family protein [Croceibacterium aestuarii]|uniref:DUF6522 family protein n=1 Tax=Croceibacterium aestuarii TaxID=3064139 RepID=UPI00272E11F0|nr:DUF6522 family protein [Croceibacterium sp. D39]
MAQTIFQDGDVEVDATIIADGLGMSPEQVQAEMRSGRLTAMCERGIVEDASTFRLSFMAVNRRLHLIVDAAGEVLRRSVLTGGDPAAGKLPDS